MPTGMFCCTLITPQGSSYVGQNKHKTVFGFSPTHHLWELRWNFLFSPLPAMHLTAYKCELAKSFQRSYLEGNQRARKQLQTNLNGWEACLWNMVRKGGLGKGHHSSRIPFQSDCTKAARSLCWTSTQKCTPAASWLFTDISTVLCACRHWEEQKCCPRSVISKEGGNKHLFTEQWYFSIYKYHDWAPGTACCLFFSCFCISTGEGESEILGWPLMIESQNGLG